MVCLKGENAERNYNSSDVAASSDFSLLSKKYCLYNGDDEKTPQKPDEPQGETDSRISPAHAHQRRPQDAQPPTAKRALAPHPLLIPASPPATPTTRLKQTGAFAAVYRRGRWVRGRALSVGVLPTGGPVTRVGLRTRRGVRPAVVRNRLKRQVRAMLASPHVSLRAGFDVVIVLHPPKSPVTSRVLEEELLNLCQKSSIIA